MGIGDGPAAGVTGCEGNRGANVWCCWCCGVDGEEEAGGGAARREAVMVCPSDPGKRKRAALSEK